MASGTFLFESQSLPLAYLPAMATLDDPRKYLLDALSRAGVTLKAASERAGMNHAYLHQFIHKGKPRYLAEQVREALAKAYGVDPERLRPPPAKPRPSAVGQPLRRTVGRPFAGELIEDPDELALVRWWRKLELPERRLVTRMMRPPGLSEQDDAA